MATLSKALGSTGGFVAADADLIGAMKSSAPGVAMLTGAPAPSAIGAALAALDVLEEEPERLARLWANARLFHGALSERGVNLGVSQGTPIVPVIVPGKIRAGYVSSTPLENGVYSGLISSPAVPAGQERLRYFITSEHTAEQLTKTVDLLTGTIARAEKIPDIPVDG
jgi:8-amino-7-oxononanoate synthase